MITQQYHSEYGEVFILLASGFEEEATIFCLTQLREAGIFVSLVGASAGLIRGAHGVKVQPDATLRKVTAVSPPKLIIIPDGKRAVSMLLSDPRVHQLLAATTENNGQVAVMPAVASMLGELVTESSLIIQSNGSLDKFTNRLINWCTAGSIYTPEQW